MKRWFGFWRAGWKPVMEYPIMVLADGREKIVILSSESEVHLMSVVAALEEKYPPEINGFGHVLAPVPSIDKPDE